MIYKQHRPPTIKILNIIKSVIYKDFIHIYKGNNNKVLDLFCGDCNFVMHLKQYIELDYVVGVETKLHLVKKAQNKLNNINLKGKIFNVDAFKFRFNMQFDFIFIDPPFQFNMCSKILKTIRNRNFIHEKTLIILRNLAKHEINLDENFFIIKKNITIGQNQIIFLNKF
jgi:16S rRNA G966 N2-methylase RsmD